MKTLFVLSLLIIAVCGAKLDGLGHQDDHHHHHEHDFPLATGKEASQASARLLEFFNAVDDDQVPFPSDMPLYNNLPEGIQFTCDNRLPGYYADVDYGCQVYHMCREDPEHGVASFLCPNATVFHQAIFACDWWFNVDCPSSPNFYVLNEDIYKGPEEEEEVHAFQQLDIPRPVRSASLLVAVESPFERREFVIPVPTKASPTNQKALNSLRSDYLPPPIDGYLPPDTGYLPPNDYLPPPTDGYLPPPGGYIPPKRDYLPPTGDYLPPK